MSNEQKVEYGEHAGAFIETAFSPVDVVEAAALEKVRGGDGQVCGFLGIVVSDDSDNDDANNSKK